MISLLSLNYENIKKVTITKMNNLKFKIKENQLIIDDDVFNINEILIGEIVKDKEFIPNYSIKLTFKDEVVDKWIILVNYSSKNKSEILYNFESLLTAIKNNNPNFTLYNNKYFLNLDIIDDINIDQKLF